MKTTFILLACLLVITGANIVKKCNNKAEEIASQDCKQECNVVGPGEDCAKCIMEHKDYDNDCKGITFLVQCMRADEIDCKGANDMLKHCMKTLVEIVENDCKDQCPIQHAREKDFDPSKCKTCCMSHQDLGLACLVQTGVSFSQLHLHNGLIIFD